MSLTFDALRTHVQCKTALVDADGLPVPCMGWSPPASEGRGSWRVNTFTGEVAFCMVDSRVTEVFNESGLNVIPKKLVLCVKGEDYKPR